MIKFEFMVTFQSTVINLLLRFYDPLRGCIKLDGYNVKDLNIRWLRSQIGYIGQEPALFPVRIFVNCDIFFVYCLFIAKLFF